MPWREKRVVKLREEFVLRALEPGANMSALCREYSISRKTGYKWVQRFREGGVEGLADLSRRPHCSPLRASGESVLRVLELRQAHPRWGPKKLHAVLARTMDADDLPSIRTIARILERAGMVRKRCRRREGIGNIKPSRTASSRSRAPRISACRSPRGRLDRRNPRPYPPDRLILGAPRPGRRTPPSP